MKNLFYSKFVFRGGEETVVQNPRSVEKKLTPAKAKAVAIKANDLAKAGKDVKAYLERNGVKDLSKHENVQKWFIFSENLKLMKMVAEKTTSKQKLILVRSFLRFSKGSEKDYKATFIAFMNNPKSRNLMKGIAGYTMAKVTAKFKAAMKSVFKIQQLTGSTRAEVALRVKKFMPRNIELSKMMLAQHAKDNGSAMIELIKTGSFAVRQEALKSPKVAELKPQTLENLMQSIGRDKNALVLLRKFATFKNIDDKRVQTIWEKFDYGISGPLKKASRRDYEIGLALSKQLKLSNTVLAKLVTNIEIKDAFKQTKFGESIAQHKNINDALVLNLWKRFPVIKNHTGTNQYLVKNKKISDRVIKMAKKNNPTDTNLADTIKSKRPSITA